MTVGRRDVSPCSVTVGRRDVSPCSVTVGRRDVSLQCDSGEERRVTAV